MQKIAPNDRLNLFFKEALEDYGPEGLLRCISFFSGAVIISCEGKITAANNAFLELSEYELEELIGLELTALVSSDNHSMLNKDNLQKAPVRWPLKLLTKSKDIKTVLISIRIIQAKDNLYLLAELVENQSLLEFKEIHIKNLQNSAKALSRAIEKRDAYTPGHMTRTAFIAIEMSKLLKVDLLDIELIFLGATLHDIGKIGIPIEILTKPGKLEPYEWEYVRQHPEIGHGILADMDIEKQVLDIVLYHHEKQDGTGYPVGLKAAEIPYVASIVGVADSLDAIAGIRPYRKAHSYLQAIDMIAEQSGKYLDEAVLAAKEVVKSGKLKDKEFGLNM